MSDVVCYIPAKGTSSGIPRKNLVDLGGSPLVAHTIDAAEGYARGAIPVVLSTDDDEIAALARGRGVIVAPRPPVLAGAEATVAQVLAHDLPLLSAHVSPHGLIVVLQPTSPFRTAEDIERAVRRLAETPTAQALVGCSRWPAPVEQSLVMADDGLVEPAGEADALTLRSRRQQHRAAFYPNGSLYVVRFRFFERARRFFEPGATLGLETGPLCAVDIDGPADLALARLLWAGRCRETA